ncbi:MAG: hypothetical protein JKY33_09470 [Bacteroidia bacterium]|nr:hypothetical protein [Bacteroidia bacterium]
MKKVVNILITLTVLWSISAITVFARTPGNSRPAGTNPDPSETQMTNEVHDGTVVRFFRKFAFGSGSSELHDLPMYVNVKDNKDGKIYESLQLKGSLAEGEQIKFYLKGEKVMVIEDNRSVVDEPQEIYTGTVIRFFRKFTFGSGSSELNDLPMMVNVKDSRNGTVYESMPLKNFLKEGAVVKYYIKGDKIVIVEN